MVSKSSSILMAIGIVAVAAVAIIGLGYAYTATTDNSGNTSEVTYITLSQGAAANYTNIFDEGVKYNSVTTDSGTTLTFDTEQLVTLFDTTKGVCLGTAVLTVAQTGASSDYNFSVQNTAGTMTGTFYIGINDGSGEVIRAYTPGSTNYYDGSAGHSAVTSAPGTAAVDNEVTSITVKMYVSAMPAPTPGAAVVKPLNGVTFQFKATVPQA